MSPIMEGGVPPPARSAKNVDFKGDIFPNLSHPTPFCPLREQKWEFSIFF